MTISPRERLTSSLLGENGGHRPARWDEALDRVAKGFPTQLTNHGPDAFGMFSCSKTTNELTLVPCGVNRSNAAE